MKGKREESRKGIKEGKKEGRVLDKKNLRKKD